MVRLFDTPFRVKLGVFALIVLLCVLLEATLLTNALTSTRAEDLQRLIWQSTAFVGFVVLLGGTILSTQFVRSERRARKAAAEAEAANSAKSDFLACMSHEMRTSLTAIMGNLDVLYSDGEIERAPERRLDTIETISRSGKHLLSLLNDILDLSKIEAGKVHLDHTVTSVSEVLRDVIDLVRPQVDRAGLQLLVRNTTPLPEVIETDAMRWKQILLNLLSNAIKFTPSGTITIEASAVEHPSCPGQLHLRVVVRDTGRGMCEDDAQRLFQPFRQADSTRMVRGGTGLGLVISRKLATMLGGDVSLLSSELGKGSAFECVIAGSVSGGMLQHLDGITQRPHSATAPSLVRLSGRVLLAEDSEDNQRLLSYFLRKAGADVDIAGDGKVAVEMVCRARAEAREYGLVLMDMQMPVLDGYGAVRALRERGERVPIIAITAHAMHEDRARCLAGGCDEYATKPIERAALLALCARWVGVQQQRSAA